MNGWTLTRVWQVDHKLVVAKTIEDAIAWLEKQGEFYTKRDVDNAYIEGMAFAKNELEKQGKQKGYTFKSIPRLLDMIEPSDKAKAYCQKLIDTLVKERYNTDAKIVEEVLNGWNGEDVPMAVMDEQKPVFEIKTPEESLGIDSDTYNKIVDECIYGDGEQKPTDKVEPKSNIEKGKWYVCDTSRYTDFVVGKAYFCPKNGMLKPNENEIARYVAKDCFHLWIIQDAKDGDVLYSHEHNLLWIYKDKDTYYVAINLNYTHNISNGADMVIPSDVCPATKEQREQLKKAMADAGYVWNAEKKELKKIHVIDEGKAEMDYCFTKMMNGERVSPAWSEEDEEELDIAVSTLKEAGQHDSVKWLKSLRPQNRWKPSDEQMKALKYVAYHLMPDENYREEMFSLYEELKKLN